MKREFLQLSQTHSSKYGIGGWFESEKLDGMRLFWDGGVSRGMLKSDVPWANTNKDERYQVAPVSTGLWSRYGNVIHAPDWWLDELPKTFLDGEGFTKRNDRQYLMSIVKDLIPTDSWIDVTFQVFGMPSPETIFANGYLNNTNYVKTFNGIVKWLVDTGYVFDYVAKPTNTHRQTYFLLNKYVNDIVKRVPQNLLPFQTSIAEQRVSYLLDKITDLDGEGLILINPDQSYCCERSHHSLKVKKLDDAEAVVIGHTTGRVTSKGSKLLGMMGALVVQFGDVVFELSGFTDDERELNDSPWATENPDTRCPFDVFALSFPVGRVVTFRYRGLSRDGIPQEARYWRKYAAD